MCVWGGGGGGGGVCSYRWTVKLIKIFEGLVIMNLGLVHASYSLPKGPVVKLTFFASLCYQQIYKPLTIPVSTINGSCGK